MSIENSNEVDNDIIDDENTESLNLDEIVNDIESEEVDDFDTDEEIEDDEDEEEASEEDTKRKNGINKKFSKQSRLIKELKKEIENLKSPAKKETGNIQEELKEPEEPDEDNYTIDQEDKYKEDMKKYRKELREYDRKLAILEYKKENEKEHEKKIQSAHEERLDKAMKRYKDFGEIQGKLQNVTSGDTNQDIEVANLIKNLEYGPDILYKFSKDIDNANKIMKMPSDKRKTAIKKLNEKIADSFNKKNTDMKPISTVKSNSKTKEVEPTSSMEAWYKHRLEQISKRKF